MCREREVLGECVEGLEVMDILLCIQYPWVHSKVQVVSVAQIIYSGLGYVSNILNRVCISKGIAPGT